MPDLVAAGYLGLALDRMLDKYPLLGGIINACQKIEFPAVETMGVSFDPKTGFLLYYAPAFVSSLPIEQVVAVLIHEARHLIYDHVFQQPDQFPDTNALRIAQETVVNERMPERLPDGAILISQFPGLPEDENTIERYRQLAKKTQPPDSRQDGKSNSSCHAPADKGTSGSQSPENDQDKKAPRKANSGAANQVASGDLSTGDGGSAHAKAATRATKEKPHGTTGPAPKDFDNHDYWQECRNHEDEARSNLISTLEALAEQGVVPNVYEEVMIEEGAMEAGSNPGSGLAVLKRIFEPVHVPWQRILRNYAGKLLKRQYTLRWPSRRHPRLIGIVPGTKGIPHKPKIMVVVDTSGSMPDQVLSELSEELRLLSRTHEIWVVECDTRIHKFYKFTKPIRTFHGRGGTSFFPPFEKSFLKKIKPELIVYATDGFGAAPERGPRVPVIWLLTTHEPPPATWGVVARFYQPNIQTPT